MYCRICGEKLAEDAKFCHKCGTEVFGFSKEEPAKIQAAQQKEEIHIEGLKEDFQWNVHTFPGGVPKKTDNTDFDWGVENEFKHQKQAISETALAKEPEVPDFLKPQENLMDVEVLERVRAKEIEEEIHEEAEEVALKKEEPSEMTVEEPVKEILSQKEPQLEEIQPEENLQAQAPFKPDTLAKKEEETFTREIEDPKTEPVVEVFEEIEKEDEIKEPEVIVAGEDLEKEIFAGDGETQDEDRKTTVVDKFYTFNEKNAEFQKLLDQEYEKFTSGKTPSKEEFHANIEDIKRRTLSNLPNFSNVETGGMISEMAEARAQFFDDDIVENTPKEPLKKKVTPVEEAKKPKEISDSKEVENKEAIPKVEKEVKEEWDKTAFFDEGIVGEEPKKEKTGKASKIIIGLLIIIFVFLLALAGIKIIAPESALSQKIDDTVNNFLGGSSEEKTPQSVEMDRTKAQEDKTGLIQLQFDKNKNENIGTIKYNPDLAYSNQSNYGNSNIQNATIITNNFLGEKDGKKVYVDESCVGAAIAYASAAPMKIFEIGELRQGGAFYYLWVAEVKEERTEKIYEMQKEEERMEVVNTYNI